MTSKSAVHLTLPEACASVFEMVLDHMYDERARRESSSMAADLTPERALGMLWLAGRLEMAGLQAQLVQHLERAVTPANAHLYLSAALELGLSKVGEAASRLTAAALDSLPRGACDAMPLDAVERLLAMAAAATPSTSASGVVGAMGATAAGRDRVLASYLRARDAAGRLDEESYRRLMRRHSAAGGGGSGSSADAEAEDDDGGDEGEVEAGDVLLLLDLALRFGDAGLERRWARRAARGFGGLREEDLGRLPARVVAELLGDDALAVETEDQVHRAAAAYLAARQARGAPAAEVERRAVWGSCRFAYCSAGVQAELARAAEAEGGGLAQEFLWGVVAERRRREEGGEAATTAASVAEEELVVRRLGSAAAAGSAQARARRRRSPVRLAWAPFKHACS
jgi:hypothetical protein